MLPLCCQMSLVEGRNQLWDLVGIRMEMIIVWMTQELRQCVNLVSWQLKSANVKDERSVILLWGSYIIFLCLMKFHGHEHCMFWLRKCKQSNHITANLWIQKKFPRQLSSKIIAHRGLVEKDHTLRIVQLMQWLHRNKHRRYVSRSTFKLTDNSQMLVDSSLRWHLFNWSFT